MLRYGCEFVVKTSYSDNRFETAYEKMADPRAAVARAMIVYTDLQMYYERVTVLVEAMAARPITDESGKTVYEC